MADIGRLVFPGWGQIDPLFHASLSGVCAQLLFTCKLHGTVRCSCACFNDGGSPANAAWLTLSCLSVYFPALLQLLRLSCALTAWPAWSSRHSIAAVGTPHSWGDRSCQGAAIHQPCDCLRLSVQPILGLPCISRSVRLPQPWDANAPGLSGHARVTRHQVVPYLVL